MTFKKFVTTTNFNDTDIKAFTDWIKHSKFPSGVNSPDAHIIFFTFSENPISEKIIIGYKKAMINYYEYDRNLLNKSYKGNKRALLDIINRV